MEIYDINDPIINEPWITSSQYVSGNVSIDFKFNHPTLSSPFGSVSGDDCVFGDIGGGCDALVSDLVSRGDVWTILWNYVAGLGGGDTADGFERLVIRTDPGRAVSFAVFTNFILI